MRAGRSSPPLLPPPLDALAGVGEGGLIGALGDRQALEADLEAGVVHHREHRGHAALLLADEVADRARIVPERHHAGRARVDPELLFQGDAAHLVARPRRAVRVEQELGDQEQRDAARAGRRVRRARQHHVDGVLGVVVLAEGDEDLGAADPVMVALAHRPGPERADVRAGVRLGQAHGAGPFAADQLGQIARALLRGAVMEQQLHPGLGEDRAQAEREVGAVPHLPHRDGHAPGQALTAPLLRERQPVPAVLDELPVRLLVALGRAHRAVLQPRALPITGGIERRELVRRELARRLEHLVDQIGRGGLASGQARDLLEAGDVRQREADVVERRNVGGHRSRTSS